MFGETAHLFGNQIIEMACKGVIELKAKNNITLNLFPLGLLCDFVINKCIKGKYLGQTINLYPDKPTKILDYVKKISYYTKFRMVSNISGETPIYPKCLQMYYLDFWSHFDNEICKLFIFSKKMEVILKKQLIIVAFNIGSVQLCSLKVYTLTLN